MQPLLSKVPVLIRLQVYLASQFAADYYGSTSGGSHWLKHSLEAGLAREELPHVEAFEAICADSFSCATILYLPGIQSGTVPESVALSSALPSRRAESQACTRLRAGVAAGLLSPNSSDLLKHACVEMPAMAFQLLSLLGGMQGAPWRAKGVLLVLVDAAAEWAAQRRSCAADRGDTNALECLLAFRRAQAVGHRAVSPGLLASVLDAVVGNGSTGSQRVRLRPLKGASQHPHVGRMTTAVHFDCMGGLPVSSVRIPTHGFNGVVADMDLPATLQDIVHSERLRLAPQVNAVPEVPAGVYGWLSQSLTWLFDVTQMPSNQRWQGLSMLKRHQSGWKAFADAVLDTAFGATGQHAQWLQRGLDAASVSAHWPQEEALFEPGDELATNCALAGATSQWCADLSKDERSISALRSSPPRTAASAAAHMMARVAERWVRVACNLEERLHVGYQLYMGWVDNFVTEGEYCPMLALMHVGCFLWMLEYSPGMPAVAAMLQLLPVPAVGVLLAQWAQQNSMAVAHVWGVYESTAFLILWLAPLLVVGTLYLKAVLALCPAVPPPLAQEEPASDETHAKVGARRKKWGAMTPEERLAFITQRPRPYQQSDAYTAAAVVIHIMAVTLCTLLAFPVPLLFSVTCVPLILLFQSRAWVHPLGKAATFLLLVGSVASLWLAMEAASLNLRTSAPMLLESVLLSQPILDVLLLAFTAASVSTLWVLGVFFCIC